MRRILRVARVAMIPLPLLLFPLAGSITDAFSLARNAAVMRSKHVLIRGEEIGSGVVASAAVPFATLRGDTREKRLTSAITLAVGDDEKINPPSELHLLGVAAWLVAVSAFIVVNVKAAPFPQALLFALTRSQWSLVHAISSMLFGGTIILSTLIEHLVVSSRKNAVLKFWFLAVPSLDTLVVLPALTGSIVSGIAQATIDYGGMIGAPKHVTGAVHALLTFGLWWGITDVTTQRRAETLVRSLDETERRDADDDENEALSINTDAMRVLRLRRMSNVISCIMVASLYSPSPLIRISRFEPSPQYSYGCR